MPPFRTPGVDGFGFALGKVVAVGEDQHADAVQSFQSFRIDEAVTVTVAIAVFRIGVYAGGQPVEIGGTCSRENFVAGAFQMPICGLAGKERISLSETGASVRTNREAARVISRSVPSSCVRPHAGAFDAQHLGSVLPEEESFDAQSDLRNEVVQQIVHAQHGLMRRNSPAADMAFDVVTDLTPAGRQHLRREKRPVVHRGGENVAHFGYCEIVRAGAYRIKRLHRVGDYVQVGRFVQAQARAPFPTAIELRGSS